MREFLARWMPENASAHGPTLDHMNALVHWLMAALFVGWGLYFIYVLFRFRAGRNPKANPQGATSHLSTWSEVGIVVIEAVLLIGFAIPAWAKWTNLPDAGDNPVEVRVIGEQFAWNAHYPGPDGVFGRQLPTLIDAASNPIGLDPEDPASADDIVSINQLHLPVDRPAKILLSSKDVIHSFGLPVMRVKQDAIPGMETPIHFTPVKVTPEEAKFPACAATKSCWEIACAQLCGLGHFRMRGFLVVETQAEFDAWLASLAKS